MSFDAIQFARQNRLKTRNINDGGPVPPARRAGTRRGHAYRGAAEREDAIIGRDGYVTAGGCAPGRIGFVVLCRSARALRSRLAALRRLGATITQLGDSEAAGYAPVSRVAEVLEVLHPFKRREGPAGARFRPSESTRAA